MDWWKAFNDPQLDRLVAQLLTGNPTLQGALARIRAAQAELSVARTAQYPNIKVLEHYFALDLIITASGAAFSSSSAPITMASAVAGMTLAL